MADRQLVYDVLSEGAQEHVLSAWWLYAIWLPACVAYPFMVHHIQKYPDSPAARRYEKARRIPGQKKWPERHPFLFAGIGLLFAYPLFSAALAHRSDSTLLRQGSYSTYKWTLDADTFVDIIGSHPRREQDRLNVGAVEFRIVCNQSPGRLRKIGEPGTCLPVELGDVLEVAYKPAGVGKEVHALRVWRLPQNAIADPQNSLGKGTIRLPALLLPPR